MNNSSKHCILTIINASFNNRVERTQFLVNKFGKYLTGEILDVGCDQAPLKDIVKSIKYTGIDIDGKPTIKVDLERIDRLPFVDREFEVVVCCDVLEHIDNLHQIFGEIVRVAKKTIIVSLPNNWTNARRPIEKGRGTFAFYGLPAQKPQDRHKWFFGLSEAWEFYNIMRPIWLVVFCTRPVWRSLFWKPRMVYSPRTILRKICWSASLKKLNPSYEWFFTTTFFAILLRLSEP